MSLFLSRRDLLRRGAALAGGLLASQAFVLPVSAAPAPNLTARLVPRAGIEVWAGSYSVSFSLLVRNAGPEMVVIDGQEVALALSMARDPNSAPVELMVFDEAVMVRSMPDTRSELVAGLEQNVTMVLAMFPAEFVPSPAWFGQIVQGVPEVAVWMNERRIAIPCAPVELVFPRA